MIRADIQGLMGGELGNWLADQQSMRDAARKKAFNRWFYGGLALLPLIAFLWFVPGIGSWRMVVPLIAFTALSAWGYAPISEAKRAIKVGINSAIARQFGIEYSHDVTPGPEYEAARTYGLIPGCDRDSFEDCWHGTLEGHGFGLYEAHLEERRGSGKNRRWVTVFRGAIMRMEFGRPFHSTTLLQRAGKHRKWLGLGGRADHATFRGHRLDYVDQVHPDFEDVFEVWSDDQVEARVLIHPSYVEHLLALEQAFHGDAVRAIFTRGEVILAVESGDLFESGSMNADEDHARVAEAAQQFGAMAGLALAINQNERGRLLRAD
ncbi:MAG: DUF3137 domain-containing protein [Erythrobacter sp.]|uniref:DUF3137 domain-containing protein n=1 Tax=Erythrobacter sp. TaxID=1042 RepID=UPI003A86BEC1